MTPIVRPLILPGPSRTEMADFELLVEGVEKESIGSKERRFVGFSLVLSPHRAPSQLVRVLHSMCVSPRAYVRRTRMYIHAHSHRFPPPSPGQYKMPARTFY